MLSHWQEIILKVWLEYGWNGQSWGRQRTIRPAVSYFFFVLHSIPLPCWSPFFYLVLQDLTSLPLPSSCTFLYYLGIDFLILPDKSITESFIQPCFSPFYISWLVIDILDVPFLFFFYCCIQFRHDWYSESHLIQSDPFISSTSFVHV